MSCDYHTFRHRKYTPYLSLPTPPSISCLDTALSYILPCSLLSESFSIRPLLSFSSFLSDSLLLLVPESSEDSGWSRGTTSEIRYITVMCIAYCTVMWYGLMYCIVSYCGYDGLWIWLRVRLSAVCLFVWLSHCLSLLPTVCLPVFEFYHHQHWACDRCA